jgi:hypothetical protein
VTIVEGDDLVPACAAIRERWRARHAGVDVDELTDWAAALLELAPERVISERGGQ